jgi:hypothetical protein
VKNGGIERLFVGWDRPTLDITTEILRQRWGQAHFWNLSEVLIVVPGRQAGRRLREKLRDHAQAHSLRLSPPDIITPSELPERLYAAPSDLDATADALCAWFNALKTLPQSDRELLAPTSVESGTLSRLGLADTIAAARSTLMAEGLTFADAATLCAELPGFCDDARWAVLVRLETAYQEALIKARLYDRDDARQDALRQPTIVCEKDIWLVGTVDLSHIERALLRTSSPSIIAVIAAPECLQEGFDDIGVLVSEFWRKRPLPISPDQLCFPNDPSEEAQLIADGISAWTNQGEKPGVTVGVGDERAADGLARRLAGRGLPTHSPYGRPLDHTRPAALLASLRDFLGDPSARRFAALVRHPDLENWVPSAPDNAGARGDNPTPPLSGAGGVLAALDDFLAERLPERMPPVLPPAIEAASQAVNDLLAPLHKTQTLTDWAEPLRKVLRTVYADNEPKDDAEGRQLTRALQGIENVLQSMAGVTPSLAPRLSGQEALTFVLGRLRGPRLPDDFHPDGIEMRGWLELALDDAPALFLTGLHEGTVPSSSVSDPWLPETLRRHLGLPDTLRRQARDAYLLRVMLESRPSVSLFAARRGTDGEPRRPSRLLFLCDGETAAHRAAEFTTAEPAAQKGSSSFTPGIARRLPPPLPEPIAEPLNRLRVTAFGDYLTCPYRFYLNHVLKLTAPDVLEDEMTASRFGELLHDSLAAFAGSSVAESPDANAVQTFLRAELGRQARKNFGSEMSAPLRLQARQALRRLDAFARWQATQTAQGWLIQHDLAERELEAELIVDDRPFTLTGRLDRVDYHPGEDRYRILDYKTGNSGIGPEKKHRGSLSPDGIRPWSNLQLPLYRLLAKANGININRLEIGYVLLPAELRETGYAGVDWTDEDFQDAQRCAEGIIRALRQEIFWPPAMPPRYPDAYSSLCLDGCRDRQDWFEPPPSRSSPPPPQSRGRIKTEAIFTPPLSEGEAGWGSEEPL